MNYTEVKNLLIFPGEIFPLNMGARRRVYNLITHLNNTEYKTDLMIITSKEIGELEKKKYDSVAPRTFFITSKSKRLSLYENIKKFINKRKTWNQESFLERIHRKKNINTIEQVTRLSIINNYTNIIVSYAWMMWIVDDLIKLKKINIICDTYDVQYTRNTSIFSQTMNTFDSSKDKEIELTYLKKANYILAISKNDFVELNQYVTEKKLVLCTIDFDYIFNSFKQEINSVKENFSFGFIGSNMIANQISIDIILTNWWPAILKESPNSKLYIAGSICSIVEKTKYTNIILMHNVESVESFYNNIDCLLFPNNIRGGINIKLYESLFAYKIIVSNDINVDKSIRKLLIQWNEEDVKTVVEKILHYQKSEYYNKVKELYIHNFKSTVVYRDLKQCLYS